MRVPRRLSRVGRLGVGLLLGCSLQLAPIAASADSLPQQLAIKEINITGDEFVVLQNSGGAPIDHLNMYWLGYTSSENAPNVIPTQQLPDVPLAPGEAYLLNGGTADTCGAVGAARLSFSLSNTSGTMALRQLTNSADGATSTFQTVQSVSWNSNKTSPITSGSYLHLADESNVAKYKPSAQPVWYRPSVDPPAAWQVGFVQACGFTPVAVANVGQNQPLPWQNDSDDPPFTVLSPVMVGDDSALLAIPAADVGLKAVQLSELLPNPTTADSVDEFIELYNPNNVSFDLSGFKLQYMSTTSATVHSYTFPMGTTIDGKSFKAFYSADTHLSLSNSGGKVWLIDPLGVNMGESDTYDTAKEGQTWILAGGKWQWTLAPTPNATNKLASPVVASKSSTRTSKTPITSLGTVKGSTTSAGKSANAAATSPAETTPVPMGILAAVVAAALLYGAYEYRTDLANYVHQFRRHRAARRSARD